MRTIFVAFCLACCPLAAMAADPAAKPAIHYTDDEAGFSIGLPSLGDLDGSANVTRVIFTGPVDEGFAANCNVQLQFISIGMDGFLELSKRQYRQMGLKVEREERRIVSGRPAILLEAAGTMNGRDLRFLQLAVVTEDRIWLLTCTGLKDENDARRSAFMAAVDSFKLIGTASKRD